MKRVWAWLRKPFHCISLAGCLVLGIMIGLEVSLTFFHYSPSADYELYQIMLPQGPPLIVNASKTPKKVLFCTMLSDDFEMYSFGAVKMAKAIHREFAQLSTLFSISLLDLAVVEVEERPIPPKVWMQLKMAGWQRKITKGRIPPREEGISRDRFKDQFTKLHLWTMDKEGFDWVFYMDSDVYVVRSFVPLFHDVFSASSGKNIWAVEDTPEFPDTFNMGVFAIQPSSVEFRRLLCLLYGKCKGIFPIPYAQAWAEQGFLNAVYWRNWTKIPNTNAMNLAFWAFDREAWEWNATRIQAIHFTMVKPWNWWCPFTQYAPFCHLFWNQNQLSFHPTFQ